MHVEITLKFDTTRGYEEWLAIQAYALRLQMRGGALAPEENPRGTAPDAWEAVPDMPGGATQTEPPEKEKKPRKPRKPRAKKEAAPVRTTIIPAKPAATDEVLPAAPATEAAPADGEKVYTLADSREVLTAYLNKAGNGADTLIKELSVHGAKRINQVPSEHIHGFLKRMVEAS